MSESIDLFDLESAKLCEANRILKLLNHYWEEQRSGEPFCTRPFTFLIPSIYFEEWQAQFRAGGKEALIPKDWEELPKNACKKMLKLYTGLEPYVKLDDLTIDDCWSYARNENLSISDAMWNMHRYRLAGLWGLSEEYFRRKYFFPPDPPDILPSEFEHHPEGDSNGFNVEAAMVHEATRRMSVLGELVKEQYSYVVFSARSRQTRVPVKILRQWHQQNTIGGKDALIPQDWPPLTDELWQRVWKLYKELERYADCGGFRAYEELQFASRHGITVRSADRCLQKFRVGDLLGWASQLDPDINAI